ncbi:MAG: retropepsin-like aspartic protease [Woeseiaceae bacterium]|nr:retropepsin-like aspartic protease [Woeseiaceae bacterium]
MKTRLFWLVLLLFITGCAAELVLEKDGALAVIPRQDRTSRHLLVDATVNGEGPFRLALDSGASISVLIESVADAAEVEEIKDKRVLLRGMTGWGYFPVATAERVTVGDLDWSPPMLAVLPDSLPLADRIDGLLGTDFLGQYAVAYFADDRAVRLYPKDMLADRGFRGWTSTPLYEMHLSQSDATVLVFNMIIAGQRIPAILDIGAEVSLMNRRAARAVGARTRRSKTGGVTGATGPTIVATRVLFHEVWVGNHVWHRRNFLVADFPVFEALSLHKRPAAIAGIDLFRDRDFIIDFAGGRLLVRTARQRGK